MIIKVCLLLSIAANDTGYIKKFIRYLTFENHVSLINFYKILRRAQINIFLMKSNKNIKKIIWVHKTK